MTGFFPFVKLMLVFVTTTSAIISMNVYIITECDPMSPFVFF